MRRMEQLTAAGIRDFRVRGNYLNQHSLHFRDELCAALRDHEILQQRPGYSPPVVDFELEGGSRGSVVVHETDLPLLCQDDFESARRHLGLILEARRGESGAVKDLSTAIMKESLFWDGSRAQPLETRFLVPCTSTETHTEQDISQKAFILLRLSRLNYPVPDFVVLTSQAYADGPAQTERHMADAVEQLQLLTRQRLGDTAEPLVLALRCATARYIPGLMDTYLNVGVTERTLPRLEQVYGALPARRMLLNNLRNICECLEQEDVPAAIRPGLALEEVSGLVERLAAMVRKVEPGLLQDPLRQATFLAQQCYKHFDENQTLLQTLCRGTEPYPALILQKMVCTVRHDEAYAGVVSSRHTQTGVGIELQTARNIFGEEMMTGTAEIQSTAFEDREAIRESFPAVYHFVPHLAELEREFESPVTIEFAVEATDRYQWFALLQLNETGMAGRAAITATVDLHKSGAISRQRVTELIRPYHIKQLTSDTIDREEFSVLNPFCSGISVLPRSAVSARIHFGGETALSAKSQGEKVCLCKKTFVPQDVVVMREMDAIISLTSAAVHVVTICQSFGIPALLNVENYGVTLQDDRLVNAAGRELREGDWVTISSRRRAVYEGQARFTPARLLRYMRGESVELDEDEQKIFASIAYCYRYYQQLVRGMTVQQISTLNEVTRLVNFELRGESDEARQLVNSWFDDREALYMEEVLKSDIGDHLAQSNVFEMLTLDRKIRFFKRTLEKCAREHLSGYDAGAFMLGRFLSVRYPAAFWKCFTPAETGLLVNEWVLFEKYMQLLHNVGERKVLQARKKILKEGLDEVHLHPGNVQCLITLKLGGVPLDEVSASLPSWSDPQTLRVIDLLRQPYRAFYNFHEEWSVGELRKICAGESLPVPRPEDV
jgi:hypothetical protein